MRLSNRLLISHPSTPYSKELLRSVHDIAEYYSEQVRQIPRHGPIRLVGWSSGAWIAFEMANVLQRCGEVAGSVTVLDAPPPAPNDLTLELPQNVRALGLTSDAETSAVSWWRFLCTFPHSLRCY
jgi:thioesterase domain-containing protein